MPTELLARERARLQTLINTAVDGIVVIDDRGQILSFNRACERLFGYDEAEVLGRNVNVLMPAPYHEEHDGYLAKYRDTGQAQIIGVGREVEGLRKDGTTFPLELSVGEAVFEGERNFIGILRDVTDRKRAEERLRRSEAQVRTIIETAVDGVILIDEVGSIRMYNAACELMFGYAPSDVLGENVKLLMPDPYYRQHDTYLANYRKTGTRKIIGIGREVEGRRKNGTTFPMELSVGEASLEGTTTFVGILRDISERKLGEEAMRKSNADLERAIRELTQAQDQLIQSEKLASLGALVAGVNHELNTPIGIAVTASSNLARMTREAERAVDAGQPDIETLRKYFAQAQKASDIILSNMDRAAELVRSFKQVGTDQISEGRRKFELREVLESLIRSLQPTIRRKSQAVELTCENLIPMDSFPGAVSQVITNLIMNALMHAYDGEEPGHIVVRVDGDKEAREVAIHVTDDGKGISEEFMPRIFDPFVTGDRARGGTGLGLHIVHNLVTNTLRGRLTVKSESGEGTTFSLFIPRILTAPITAPNKAGDVRGARPALVSEEVNEDDALEDSSN